MSAANTSQITALKAEIAKVVVGQQQLIERLIVALLCGGHVLIEGIPGLAKTLTVNTLAQGLGLDFKRIQFTPDLLPSDVTGTQIYNPQSTSFSNEPGPVFANLVLADEINRSPAKVQSALLEAMQEKQVTLGKQIYALPKPFLVLATQNPVEQEGTYPLPEAQVDRFLFKLKVSYPSIEDELEVMRRMAHTETAPSIEAVLNSQQLQNLSQQVDRVYLAPELERYIVTLIDASRHPAHYALEFKGIDFEQLLRFGASPRASIGLALAARAQALVQGRDYVQPDDIRALAPDVLRHRLALSYKAEAQGINSDDLIGQLIASVPLPASQPEKR